MPAERASDMNRLAIALTAEAARLDALPRFQRWRARHLRAALIRVARIAFDTTHTYDLPVPDTTSGGQDA